MLVDATSELAFGWLLWCSAHRWVAAGAHAAALGMDSPGSLVALEEATDECCAVPFLSWRFLGAWLDAYNDYTSAADTAAVIRAGGNLWLSDLTSFGVSLLKDRLVKQFDFDNSKTTPITAHMRSLSSQAGQEYLQNFRTLYGVKLSRAERRRAERDRRKGR